MPTWWVACNFLHVYSLRISWRGVWLLHALIFHMPKPAHVVYAHTPTFIGICMILVYIDMYAHFFPTISHSSQHLSSTYNFILFKKLTAKNLTFKSYCLWESDKMGTFTYWLTQFFSFLGIYNVAFVRVKPCPKENFILATSIRNMAAKIISEIWSHDNFLNFSRQYLMVPNRSHLIVMVSVF